MQILKETILAIIGYACIYPVLDDDAIKQSPWLFGLVILGACFFVAVGASKKKPLTAS